MLEVKMKKNIFLILIGHCLTLVRSQQYDCTTVCSKGQYCNEDDCFQCPPGANDDHTDTYCLKWTSMTVRNSVIIINGTSVNDVVWGCDVGFERKNISNDGSWECIKLTTISQTSPSTVTSITFSNTTSVGIETPSYQHESQETQSLLSIVLPCVIILIVIAVTVTVYWYFKKNKCRHRLLMDKKKMQAPETEESGALLQRNPMSLELNKLYHTIVSSIGIYECQKMFHHIQDESGKFSREITPLLTQKCIHSFRDWESLNPEAPHCSLIVKALRLVGYKLPSTTDLNNPVILSIFLGEMKQLKDVFQIFLQKLSPLLGWTNMQALLGLLELKYAFETIHSGDSTKNFIECVSEWSFKYPYDPNTNDWPPLTDLRNKLMEINAMHVETLDSLAEEVNCALKNYLDIKRIFYLVAHKIGKEKCEDFFLSVEFKEKLTLTSTSQCIDAFEKWRKSHPNDSHIKRILDFLSSIGYIILPVPEDMNNEYTRNVIDYLSNEKSWATIPFKNGECTIELSDLSIT